MQNLTIENYKNNFKTTTVVLRLNISQMLMSNIHLGHTCKFLNIKIKPYLLGYRNNVYILNLVHTTNQFKLFCNIIINIVSLRHKLLIVKDKDIFNLRKTSQVKNVFYYDKKWIGGVLTNYKKVRTSLRFKEENNSFNSLRAMRRMPSLVFFFDPDLSHWALKEASNLGIPVGGVIDTNINLLNFINYPIVGNNKSFESVCLYFDVIKNAAIKGRQKELLKILRII